MVDFGGKLKALRVQANLTQQQLADKIGVTKSVVSYYELQERYPSPEVLKKLAQIFHVSADYLLGINTQKVIDVSDLSDEDVLLLQHTIAVLRGKK